MASAAPGTRSVLTVERSRPRRPGGTLSVFAAVFFAGGILSAVVGFFLIAIRSVVPNQAVGEIGTFLMIVTIPMLLAGSHLLDVIDRRRTAVRKEKSGAR